MHSADLVHIRAQRFAKPTCARIRLVNDLGSCPEGSISCAQHLNLSVVQFLNLMSISAGQHFSVVKPSGKFHRIHGGTYDLAACSVSQHLVATILLRVSNWTMSHQSLFFLLRL